MFSQASVILFTEGWHKSPQADTHTHPLPLPWADTPHGQAPPGQTPPWAETLPDGYCSRWYASYWKTFLFKFVLLLSHAEPNTQLLRIGERKIMDKNQCFCAKFRCFDAFKCYRILITDS